MNYLLAFIQWVVSGFNFLVYPEKSVSKTKFALIAERDSFLFFFLILSVLEIKSSFFCTVLLDLTMVKVSTLRNCLLKWYETHEYGSPLG